jgi:uncharacterized membrane protein (UPF0136 family)
MIGTRGGWGLEALHPLVAPGPTASIWYSYRVTWPRWILVVYGLINIAMGFQAYFFASDGKAHPVSLAAGVGAGLLILTSVYVTFKNPRGGYLMSLAVCALLLLHFGRSLVGSVTQGKPVTFYPKPFSITMALVVAGALGIGHLQAMKEQAKLGPETKDPV